MGYRQVLAENIRLRRVIKKLTQVNLANKAEVEQSTISSIENCKKEPSLDTLHRIAKALGVPMSNLFQKFGVKS